jgi:predicted RNA-binding Zn-ribbon protein involved in translation (DUF1610 family)
MIELFHPGDIVDAMIVKKSNFFGVVTAVDRKCNKVYVAWNGGSVVQHDPDEISLCPYCTDEIAEKLRAVVGIANPVYENLSSRRAAGKDDAPPDFVGDPKKHGIDEPRGGGFSIMQDLQEDLHKEQKGTAGKSPTASAGMKSRRAMYWCAPERTYRLTKGEQEGGAAVCPKCGATMALEPFTKSEKMWRCPECGFKVPSGKAVTQKVEVEVTIGSFKSRRGK